MRLNIKLHCNMPHEYIFKVANSRLGSFALPNKKEDRPDLVDPLAYYLGNT